MQQVCFLSPLNLVCEQTRCTLLEYFRNWINPSLPLILGRVRPVESTTTKRHSRAGWGVTNSPALFPQAHRKQPRKQSGFPEGNMCINWQGCLRSLQALLGIGNTFHHTPHTIHRHPTCLSALRVLRLSSGWTGQRYKGTKDTGL